jgi:hypothetical protein
MIFFVAWNHLGEFVSVIEIFNFNFFYYDKNNLNSTFSGRPISLTTFLTDFSFQNLVFGIYLNFQHQKSLKNPYLPHSESKSYQINSIKSCSSRSIQKYQRHIPILKKIEIVRILFYFQWKNHSIFKNFYTTSPNAMKPS